ncbi:MAG: aminotransferase class I/II-fold pyridoxal phosphate-dependent enzyme [Pirellulales bacterium]|nr:aminotransferase class I/II-fold pyridoxal phosphate-dependent enzyme [Pirellulales bacterium]
MSGDELALIEEAFLSNWIAPLGPHVDAFEEEFAAKLGVDHAVVLSSGTAALHLALLIAGVEPGDKVVTSTLTFVATANAIGYTGAEPTFIDSERSSWNMDPQLLAEELADAAQKGQLPRAVVVVDICGQSADWKPIRELTDEYEIPLIADSAESLGATYGDRAAGTLGDIGCFSFNGNKIITTGGGGMLVTDNGDWARQVRHLATQARDPAPHYEHSQQGYNYRLSNLLAAVGRGQLRVLEQRVDERRAVFEYYQDAIGNLPGIEFMPEAKFGRSTRWLTCLLVDASLSGVSPERLLQEFAAENIEARPMWKPMHLQPLFRDAQYRGGKVAEDIFARGLCLPSGSSLTEQDLQRIASVFRSVFPDLKKPLVA